MILKSNSELLINSVFCHSNDDSYFMVMIIKYLSDDVVLAVLGSRV